MSDENIQPISPTEDEEFEFRARAEQEARARLSAQSITTEQQAPEDDKNKSLSPMQVLGGAADMAMRHPGIAGAAISAPWTVPAAVRLGQGAVNAAGAYTNSRNAQALADLAHQARMGGTPIDPTRLHDAYQNVASRMGVTPAPTITPPNPAQMAQAAATGGPSAAQGSTFIQRMAQQFGGMAQRVAPILNNPAVRTAGQLGSVGGQFGLYHGGLNTNEEQELARRRGVGFQPYPRQ